MKNKIMIIGAYGAVGREVTIKLSRGQYEIILAGRNEKAASLLMKQEKINGTFRQVDVDALKDDDFLDVDTVAICLEKNNIKVLEKCIKNKVNYVDITPSYSIINAIEHKKDAILEAGIKVGVGIGIAPGVMNVLAEDMIVYFDKVESVNTYTMLGIGEQHGKNAVNWLINNLNVKYEVGTSSKRIVKSFSEPRKISLIGESKKRSFVRIDLADWHLIQNKHQNVQVDSWFAYDVDVITKSMAFFRQMGVFNLLKYGWYRKTYLALLQLGMRIGKKLGIGSDQYAVLVEVRGKKDNEEIIERRMLKGNCNSSITGEMCALSLKQISNNETGIYYMAALIHPRDLPIYNIEKKKSTDDK